MNCPNCNKESKFRIKETRLRDGDIVRRRQCSECKTSFGTRETVDKTLEFGIGRGKNPKIQRNLNPLFKVWAK